MALSYDVYVYILYDHLAIPFEAERQSFTRDHCMLFIATINLRRLACLYVSFTMFQLCWNVLG